MSPENGDSFVPAVVHAAEVRAVRGIQRPSLVRAIAGLLVAAVECRHVWRRCGWRKYTQSGMSVSVFALTALCTSTSTRWPSPVRALW
jgi:hypothetical protein